MFKKTIFFLFIVPAFLMASEYGSINHLYVKDKSKVIIVTEGVKKINYFELSSPERIVIDYYNAENKLINDAKNVEVSKDAKIKNVRTNQFDRETVRTVIELQKPYKYEITRLNGEILVEISDEMRTVKEGKKTENAVEPVNNDNNIDTHMIEENDILNIIVTPADEVSKEIVVQSDGKITLSLLGEIKVKGLTVSQLKKLIEERLREYVENPRVSVTVKTFGYRNIFITGHVVKAGVYNYKEGMKLLELITLAGGFADKTDLKNVKIYRGEDKDKKTIIIDASKLREESKDVALFAGDIIEVSKIIGEIFMIGEIRNQGSYEYKENLKLIELISKAGGFTDKAEISSVRILRGNPPKSIIVDVGKIMRGEQSSDFVLEPGDLVFVSKSSISGWNWFVDNIVPSITLITALITAYFVITRK